MPKVDVLSDNVGGGGSAKVLHVPFAFIRQGFEELLGSRGSSVEQVHARLHMRIREHNANLRSGRRPLAEISLDVVRAAVARASETPI